MGMIYQDKTYFRFVGKILDSPSSDISLQDAEMMNLDLDLFWPSRNDVQSNRS